MCEYEANFSDKESNLKAKVQSHEAHFDARVFGLPNENEVLNNIVWRCCYDCRRNSISGAARYQFGHKAVHGLDSKDMYNKMKEVAFCYINLFRTPPCIEPA